MSDIFVLAGIVTAITLSLSTLLYGVGAKASQLSRPVHEIYFRFFAFVLQAIGCAFAFVTIHQLDITSGTAGGARAGVAVDLIAIVLSAVLVIFAIAGPPLVGQRATRRL